MVHTRLELQIVLEGIAESVYFQPPSNVQMSYPCILYNIHDEDVKHAGNRRYLHTKRYQVTVVDRNPDSELPDVVGDLPLCDFERFFIADGLNHFIYNLYF